MPTVQVLPFHTHPSHNMILMQLVSPKLIGMRQEQNGGHSFGKAVPTAQTLLKSVWMLFEKHLNALEKGAFCDGVSLLPVGINLFSID
jgi:hypothetical protein